MKEKYNWETEFDTTNRTMVHTFSERVKVVTDFKSIKVYKDNDVTYTQDCKMSVDDYREMLLSVAVTAKELKNDEGLNH